MAEERVEDPTDLADRDEIWIGAEVLTVRAAPTTLTIEAAIRSKSIRRTRSGTS